MIKMKHGVEFDEEELVNLIKSSGRDYIVQGQKAVDFADHPKPRSLDVWLRHRFPRLRNTKLADNYVLYALVGTKKFELVREACPESGRLCKSVRLV